MAVILGLVSFEVKFNRLLLLSSRMLEQLGIARRIVLALHEIIDVFFATVKGAISLKETLTGSIERSQAERFDGFANKPTVVCSTCIRIRFGAGILSDVS